MKKFLLALLLAALPAFAATKFSLYDTVGAIGNGLTPAKGQIFFTSDAFGTISPLTIGTTGWCLVVDGSGVPAWSNICAGALSSVGLSMPVQFSLSNNPLTSNGTIGIAWQTVSQNYGLFGPTSGSGVPTFRQVVGGDIGLTTKGDLPTFSTALARLGVGTDGYVLTADSTETTGLKWTTAGIGTVYSVGLSLPGEFSISGSPVTGSGTLTGAWANVDPNMLLAGPISGPSANAPSFRYLDSADLGMTTKADLLTRSSTGLSRLGVGTNGYVLMADSTETTGLKWFNVTGIGTVTSVDVTVPADFAVSGVPITGAGTIAITTPGVDEKKAWMGPTSGNSIPTFRLIQPNDLPVMTNLLKGIVPTPPNDSTQVLQGDGTWGNPPGTGTVTSVAQTVPAGFSIAGSPIIGAGTLAISFGTTTAYKLLRTASDGTVAWDDLTTAGLPAHYIGNCQPSGMGHAAGLVPDTGGSSGTSLFLREDCSFALPPQGTITSIALTAPAEITVSGSPITGSGTFGLGWASEHSNYAFMGPTTGSDDVPTFRALVGADVPPCVASGTGHKPGGVSDPGVTPGTSKFYREDCTWQTPTFSSSIEVKEVDGSPDVVGVSILRFDQAALSVTDNGGGTATVSCTGCGGGGATATRQDQFNGDGGTTVFTLGSAPVTNGIIYVSLNGLPQPTTVWSLGGSNITMTVAPIQDALLAVGYYTALPGSVTHVQDDWTGSGGTDFTLAHAPATNGVLLVSLRGLVQPQSSWSIIGSTTLRMAAAVASGDEVSASYNY